jgi:hypothetical protein
LPKLNQSLSSFKDRCYELRGLCIPKNETFPGAMFGDALINGENVQLFSFDKGISSLILKENEKFISIVIPEHMQVNPRQYYRISPLVARSEKYLAVNDRSNSCVYIFTPNGKECLSKYEVNGVIAQIALQGDRLYIVEIRELYTDIIMFNLEQPKETPSSLTTYFSDTPIQICFGKEYLIYSKTSQGKSQVVACPSLLKNVCKREYVGTLSKGYSYLFSRGSDFIEVTFRESLVCDIANISLIENRLKKTIITEGIEIPVEFQGRRADVCLHEDRLVVAFEYDGKTKFFTYDIVLEKTGKLTSVDLIGGGLPFKPRFLCVAQDIYYLITWFSNQGNVKSNLSTFTFSKI